MLDDLDALLSNALRGSLGSVTVDAATLLTGGASRETWAFDATDADGTVHPLILQRERGGSSLGGPTFAVEDRLLAAADQAGVPVPPIVADATACAALGEARITGRIDGEAMGGRIVRDDAFAPARRVLAHQLGAALAAIHRIDPTEVPGLEPADAAATIRDGLDLLEITSPAFEVALRWLEDHRPEPWPDAVVHGDLRIGNVLVGPDGLRAVLDWELAHLGDPREDLGWLCVRAWRFGGPEPVGGVGSVADLLAGYHAAGGRTVTEDDVRWWSVVGTLRWGLICAVQAHRHLDGHVQSVELAAIGRRVVENEHDVLDLIGVAPAPVTGDERPHVDHGRPAATELLDAVRSHLDDLGPRLTGADRYTLRVASNALAIVERELAAAPAVRPTIDEPALAAEIRAGATLDDATLAIVRTTVAARLAVDNPRWSAIPNPPFPR